MANIVKTTYRGPGLPKLMSEAEHAHYEAEKQARVVRVARIAANEQKHNMLHNISLAQRLGIPFGHYRTISRVMLEINSI